MAKQKFSPGQRVPASGQYAVVGPRGGKSGKEVTVVKSEPFPPTPKSGMSYILVDKTKH